MVTGQNHALVQHNRLAVLHLLDFAVARDTSAGRCSSVNVGVNQTELKRCGRTQNLFGTRSVLNTRQLDDDTVRTLTLYQRLGNTQLVHTVTQNVDVLLYGVLFGFAQAVIGHHDTDIVVTAVGEYQVTMARRQIACSFVAGRGITESQHHAVVVGLTNRGIRNALVTQVATHVVHGLLLQFAQCSIHVDFHQEVHAAAQVEAQFHRLGTQHGQPRRRRRSQVQCNNKFVTQRRGEGITGTQLNVGVIESRKD